MNKIATKTTHLIDLFINYIRAAANAKEFSEVDRAFDLALEKGHTSDKLFTAYVRAVLAERFSDIDPDMFKIAELAVLSFLRSKGKDIRDFADIDKDELFEEVSRAIGIFDMDSVENTEEMLEKLDAEEEFFANVWGMMFEGYSIVVRDLAKRIHVNYQNAASSIGLDKGLKKEEEDLHEYKMDLKNEVYFILFIFMG